MIHQTCLNASETQDEPWAEGGKVWLTGTCSLAFCCSPAKTSAFRWSTVRVSSSLNGLHPPLLYPVPECPWNCLLDHLQDTAFFSKTHLFSKGCKGVMTSCPRVQVCTRFPSSQPYWTPSDLLLSKDYAVSPIDFSMSTCNTCIGSFCLTLHPPFFTSSVAIPCINI